MIRLSEYYDVAAGFAPDDLDFPAPTDPRARTCAELVAARRGVRPFVATVTIRGDAVDEIDAAAVLSRMFLRVDPLSGISGAEWAPEDVRMEKAT